MLCRGNSAGRAFDKSGVHGFLQIFSAWLLQRFPMHSEQRFGPMLAGQLLPHQLGPMPEAFCAQDDLRDGNCGGCSAFGEYFKTSRLQEPRGRKVGGKTIDVNDQ